MLKAARFLSLPRVIAVYILAYSLATQVPWWKDSWRIVVSTATPGPTLVTGAAARLECGILLLWIPLSVFVWLRQPWARYLVAWSALLLGIAQCASYTEMLRQYRSVNIVSEVLVLAIPTFFLVAVSFCPVARDTFVRHGKRI